MVVKLNNLHAQGFYFRLVWCYKDMACWAAMALFFYPIYSDLQLDAAYMEIGVSRGHIQYVP